MKTTQSPQASLLPVDTPMTASAEPVDLVSDSQISKLVGQVYEFAPVDEQGSLLGHLLYPLGALARVSVSKGVFTGSLFHIGWHNSQVQRNDAPNVHIDHVIELVDYVQKVRVESVFAMAEMAKAWPVIASSVAWGELVTGLKHREKFHHIERDGDGFL